LLRTFTRVVNVVESYIIALKKHGLFPSLYIGDNHGTVLECHINYQLLTGFCLNIFFLNKIILTIIQP